MFKLFVVFHEQIFDACYENIPQEVLDKHFIFVSVNPAIPKTYTKNKYNVINEWELPHYNAQFQQKGYKENSVIYHVIKNKLHNECDYIGFFQYDMVFNISVMDTIFSEIQNKSRCLYVSAHNFNYCARETCNEPQVMAYLTVYYEMFYAKNFSYSKDDIYPLFNSYIIPVDVYEKVMQWVNTLYPKLGVITERTHFGHIAGLYERVMAFAIGEERLHMVKLDIEHDHDYKNALSHDFS